MSNGRKSFMSTSDNRKSNNQFALNKYPTAKVTDLGDDEQLVGEAQVPLAEKVQDGDEVLKVIQGGIEPYTEEEEKKVIRKIDNRLLWIMLAANGIQFIDKVTISAAATFGIITDANLKGQEFSFLISIFFIGYLVAQYPTNILMQRFPTGRYLTVNFLLWGATLALSATGKSFAPLLIARFFLGVFEACFSPGFVLITAAWWKREEQTFRLGIWVGGIGLIGAPAAGILFAISKITNPALHTYQWMFLISGLTTVAFGGIMWFTLPDSPVTATWLTDREREIAIDRLKDNKTGVKNTKHKNDQVKEALLDIKVWLLVAGVFFHNLTNSLQSNFTGLIIIGFGFTPVQAVLTGIPSGIILSFGSFGLTYFLSTKWGRGKRIWSMVGCYIPGIVSTVMLYKLPLDPSTKGAHLAAIFILGIVSITQGILFSLLASNIAGYTKKVVAGSIVFAAWAIANIISPLFFLESEAPRYQTGIAVSLMAFCANILVFIALFVCYYVENKKRDKDPEGAEFTPDSKEDLLNAFSDLTDKKNKKMRYML